MKNKDIDGWVVLEGKPVFTGRTRKQIRKFIKHNKKERGKNFRYIGKCVGGFRKIILDT